MTGVKEECIYAGCVGLAEDNKIPTKPPISKQSPTQEKQEVINQSVLSETTAIETKKKRRMKRKFLPFHTPSTGPH